MVYVNQDDPFEFSTDNEYWINRIIEDAKKYPDDIKILKMPQENDGMIKAMMKFKYMDIRPEQIQFWDGSVV